MSENNPFIRLTPLRRGIVLLSLLLATAGMMFAAQLLFAQEPTPATPVNEAIEAYINAHIIRGDVMPTPQPAAAEEVVAQPQGGSNYGVALPSNMTHFGHPGELVVYALTLTNTGILSDAYQITAVSVWSHTIVPTQTLNVEPGDSVNFTVAVQIPLTATNGSSSATLVTATSQGDPLVSNSVQLTTVVAFPKAYLPFITRPVPPPATPVLSATRPNSANDWQMNWSVSSNQFITGYELQQSQDPTFTTGVTTYTPGAAATSQLINTIEPSANNVYYHRIRALGPEQNSGWSNTVRVVGAYYDDFSNNQTGWSGPTLKDALRRLTYIEKVDSWYENNNWLILRVEDSWDWAIASPLKPAPEPPYVIEFRSMPANLGNLVSHGVVFGGDWNGEACPDWSTFLGVYAHDRCFNHFYNTNLIWSSDNDLTLLWERVDTLVWCPSCGGSPLKRLGHVPPAQPFSMPASVWNTYRIEVRATEIKFFINGVLRYTYNDTRWINDPYFGVFASTDEYSNSTWRFDYIRVTPLEN